MAVKKTPLFFLTLLFVSIGIGLSSVFLSHTRVYAATTGEWVNAATIKIGNNTYTDGKWDSSFNYYLNGSTDCGDEIHNFNGDRATLTTRTKDPLTGDCKSSDQTITLTNSGNATIYFNWVDSGTLEFVYQEPALFAGQYKQLSGQPTVFAVDNGQSCKSSVKTNGPSSGTLTTRVSLDGCNTGDTLAVKIGNVSKSTLPANTGTPTVGSGSANTPAPAKSCETAGNGALSWIFCPIIETLDSAVNWLDQQIQSLLVTPNPQDVGSGLHQAWGQVRNIALIILVPIMLVMVISTALGFSFLDAYTVRRAMPRFLIAILFISISWYITSFLVTLTNTVGTGVLGLITSPFGAAQSSLSDLVSSGLGAGITVTSGVVFVGMTLAGSISFGIIGSFALVTVAALLIGFVVLTMRQLLILVLVIFAPLAILSWIFPNNDKLWKLWWESFSKLLLMFPLVMILIGAGKDFALIIHNTTAYSGVDNILKELMIIIAYILPYFFIPATFKVAGGAFGTITGMVNDRGRGFFDKQKQKRAQTREGLHERASSNNRFNPNNRFVKKFKLNDLGSMAASPGSNIAYYGRNLPGLSGKGQKIASQIESAQIGQTGKYFEELNSHGFNDKAYRALSGAYNLSAGAGGFSEGVRSQLISQGFMSEEGKTLKHMNSMENINGMAKILEEHGKDSEVIAANVLRGQSGRMLSLYSDPEMGKASAQAAGMIGLASHGFADGQDVADIGNDLMSQGFSSEVTQALVSTAQVAGQRQRPDLKAGYGTIFDPNANDGKGGFIDGMSEEGGRAMALIKTLSSQDLASAKAGSIKKLSSPIKQTLAGGGGEAQAVKDQLFGWAGPYSQASVAVKAEAMQIIQDSGLQQEFESRRRAETDPSRRGEVGAGGEEEG